MEMGAARKGLKIAAGENNIVKAHLFMEDGPRGALGRVCMGVPAAERTT